MVEECPLCQNPASATVKISMGDTWRDTLGRPPDSIFSEYPMVHAVPVRGGKQVFLHRHGDLNQ